jgi:hypothetical protein
MFSKSLTVVHSVTLCFYLSWEEASLFLTVSLYIDCEAPVVYYDSIFMCFQAFHYALHAHAFSQAHPVV